MSGTRRRERQHTSETSGRRRKSYDTSSDEEAGPPLQQHLIEAPPPPKCKMPQLQTYDGTADPQEHVQTYRTIMEIQDADDSFLYQAFPTTLVKAAQDWYNSLPSRSIRSFGKLSRKFCQQFVANKRRKKSSASLLNIRYGPIFKSNIVGQPVIVSTDPEFNHYIFQQEGRLFQSWYPYTVTEIFGRQNISTLNGFMYKYLKSLVLSLFGLESLKENLLPEIEEVAKEWLSSWSNQCSVELKDGLSAMIFYLTAKKLVSYDPDGNMKDLRQNFVAFIEGLISFPINIPGTSYNRCMQGRKNAMAILKKTLKERRASPRSNNNDFFDHIIEELHMEKTLLTEQIALDLMFVLLFASYETTSLALTMAVKFIREHPEVQERLTKEHQDIISRRENIDSKITWQEYKSMTFTSQVINETVRLANIAPVIFRKPIVDVKTKDGYTIPAGWGIMVCPPAVHMNPNIYEDPTSFNPWRWEGIDTYGGSKSFMAFGGGMRFCVGAEFSRLQMAIFLHHLIIKYRWEAIKGGEILRTPGLSFPNGFHIKLTRKDKQTCVALA